MSDGNGTDESSWYLPTYKQPLWAILHKGEDIYWKSEKVDKKQQDDKRSIPVLHLWNANCFPL